MRSPRSLLLATGLLSVSALAAGLLPASAAAPATSDHLLRPLAGSDSGTFPGSEVPLGDRDARGPWLPPLASAQSAVASLGAGVEVSWTRYGTPRVLTRPGGWLARGLAGTPEQAARAFLRARPGLLGLSAAQVDDLELVSDTALSESAARVLLFRQLAGGLRLAEDGLVTVGVRDGAVASLSSSAVGARTLGAVNTVTPRLSAEQGVLAALRDAGITTLTLNDLTVSSKVEASGFTRIAARGLAQVQRARLRALPTTDRGTRLVWETAVQDVAGGRATAAASFVDAVTGEVLLRRDAVDTAAQGTRAVAGMRSIGFAAQAAPSGGQFSGSFTRTACSDPVPLLVPPGTRTIAVVAAALLTSNDIVIKINRGGTTIASGDTATSPEVATASLAEPAREGEQFTTQICPFDASSMAPYEFVGSYVTSDQGPPPVPGLPRLPLPGGALSGPPTWRYFPSNPTLPRGAAPSGDDRSTVCAGAPRETTAKDLSGCDIFTYSDTSPLPYDVEATTGLPTFTTLGNNAVTTNAQYSTSLTPGPPLVSPVSPTRDYAPPFRDTWHTSRCDPLSIVDPARRADIDASVVNLFVGHNRIHDFAYRLGLTEPRGAMQVNNFGKGGAEGDPEVGNTQNAAATNPVFGVTNQVTTPAAGLGLTGRNNANQITLQDGIPGITNQYLFQPIVGFYGPCTDGDLDASIFLHEYTHAISNRLVAGPETGLSGEQGRAMGESWSDLVAVEYLQAFDLAGKRGEDPYSVGAYATGDTVEGIRDYNMRPSRNPLTYGEYGFDATGPEVHADGEIWNAIQMTVREALMKAYDGRFPSTDKALQAACALGRTASGAVAPSFEGCPGNRRWVTYLFDAMILQANGEPTFVDQKNMMLAADMLRTRGVDQRTLANAFASRGLGAKATARDSEDTDPTPSFASPTAADNATVTFRLVDATTGKPVKGEVFAGTYQARATPVASVGGAGPSAKAARAVNTTPTASFVSGAYRFVVRAPGYGLQRFSATLTPGTRTQTFTVSQNVASATRGAQAAGDGFRLAQVIDDDEGTNGGFDGVEQQAPVAGRSIVVDLAGDLNTISRIAVSALHRPADPDVDGDFGGGRLLGVRGFDLQASTDRGKTYTTVYRSPENFFPADRPRAVAPDLNLRTVTLPRAIRADHLKLVVRSNQCTGAPDFRGEQEADPLSDSDCPSTANAFRVTVTELQAFGASAVRPRAVAATLPRGGTSTGGTS
ncbi:MAG: peptidase fungalysin, partial [Frankiales bacterium]|nr:peptidase fungalysin [Frankiales bacterium]